MELWGDYVVVLKLSIRLYFLIRAIGIAILILKDLLLQNSLYFILIVLSFQVDGVTSRWYRYDKTVALNDYDCP